MMCLPPPKLWSIIGHVERARESVRAVTMLEFQHGNVGNARTTAAEIAQKIAVNPLTDKA